MKGTINDMGQLYFRERAAMCPFDSDGSHCGDWCLHFGEPQLKSTYTASDYMKIEMKIETKPVEKFVTAIEITCGNGRTLIFDDFIDERKNS